MENLKKLYILILVGVVGYLIYVFGVAFDDYSEAQLMTLSYVFVPATAFSVTGLITLKKEKNLMYSLIAGLASAVLLFIFFGVLWESL